MFPQASPEDRAGLFLHRISSGIRPSFMFYHSESFTKSCLCVSQNQLLTKGMVILRDKIRFYEGVADGRRALNGVHGGLHADV